MKARSTQPRQPHQMTRDETAFTACDWFVSQFENRRYEAITLRQGEIRYTPDFSGVDIKTGEMCLFEVKASDNPHAYTPVARLRLRSFAEAFGELTFYVCIPVKGTKRQKWSVEIMSNRTRKLETGIGPNFAQDESETDERPNYQPTQREARQRKAGGLNGGVKIEPMDGQAAFLECDE